ncbi:MAG: glycosyltransferase family 4 protein [Thermodesulfobacteriota bacterium]
MRILVLSKRQYTNRDLINDRFGRLWELPMALASSGDNITGVCLSYRRRDEGSHVDAQGGGRVTWHKLNIHRLLPWGARNYWRTIDEIGRDVRPDVVWACSDSLHAVLAVNIAKRLGSPLVIDLYDNFESFTLTRLPGMTTAFRRSLSQADGITCVSHPLAEYLRDRSLCRCPIEVIENAVPEGLFYPMDKSSCRRELNLPADGFLIGMAGAISRSRGVNFLFRAFEQFSMERPDAHLVLAGVRDKGLSLHQHPRIHYLGILAPKVVPVFLSALDMTVICNRASAFGNYCFPQKFYEAIACGVPMIAARTRVMRDVLKDYPGNMFDPENTDSLLVALRRQAARPVKLQIQVQTWPARARQLKKFFERVSGAR